MRIDLFLNDSYKILNLLYENQTVVLDKKVVPLTQSEIANELGMSKAKVKRVRKQLEVDFVVNQGNQRYYIQVAYDMTSEEKQTQEFNSLRNIPDSFKKVVIVNGSKKPWRNDEGFVIMGMKYFLLDADSLEF